MSQMENMAVPAVGNMSKEEASGAEKSYECKGSCKEKDKNSAPCYGKCGVCSLILLHCFMPSVLH